MSELDLQSLLGALQDHKLRFIVIGGVAVGAHGYLRTTEDLDLVPDPDPVNLGRLIEALVALDATLPTADGRPFDPSTDASAIKKGRSVSAETKFGDIDVVQRARGVPSYSVLETDAIESDLLGIPVRVCSLAKLRDMKLAQGRTQDLADLENLPDS